MGLDMFLIKKTYVGADYAHRNVTGVVNIKVDGRKLAIDFKKVNDISEIAGYWRKANAIHRWFVENIQEGVDDCGEYLVSWQQLQQLLTTCKAVLEKNEEEYSATHLPSQAGFFFGGTDYDEGYIQDVENTITILEELTEAPEVDYYYQSSW